MLWLGLEFKKVATLKYVASVGSGWQHQLTSSKSSANYLNDSTFRAKSKDFRRELV
jgi:hypothetical protein